MMMNVLIGGKENSNNSIEFNLAASSLFLQRNRVSIFYVDAHVIYVFSKHARQITVDYSCKKSNTSSFAGDLGGDFGS